MLWMPSSPSTTLPPYFLMGFSACSDVGARFTGAGAKDVVLCSSAYTARSFIISRQRHARIALAMFRLAIVPRGACTQVHSVAKSWLLGLLVSYMPLARCPRLSRGVAGLLERREGETTAVDNRWKCWPSAWLTSCRQYTMPPITATWTRWPEKSATASRQTYHTDLMA